ncbi:MAG TPA: hypothetical protein VF880_02390, partial [Actinomycetes bacterium]
MSSDPRMRLGLALLAVAMVATVAIVVGLTSRNHPAPGPAGAPTPAPSSAPPTTVGGPAVAAPPARPCPARPRTTRMTGVRGDAVHVAAPANDTTYDLRGLRSTAYPDKTLYPLSFGDVRHGAATGTVAQHLCVIGGTVVGQQPRSLTWQQVKHTYDGDGLRVQAGGWYVVDGLRVDNVEDGISPFGDGFVGRGLYFTYIRDD